jgi:hypothetical protein
MRSTIGLTIRAEGEIRNADGNLVERVPIEETVEVPISELQQFTDDQLRAAGLDEPTITTIRSTQ